MIKVEFHHINRQASIHLAIKYVVKSKFPYPYVVKSKFPYPYNDNTVAMTRCIIWRDEMQVGTGFAFCSDKDNFCKRIGRNISLGRAAKMAGLKVKWNKEKRELELDEE